MLQSGCVLHEIASIYIYHRKPKADDSVDVIAIVNWALRLSFSLSLSRLVVMMVFSVVASRLVVQRRKKNNDFDEKNHEEDEEERDIVCR